ncbi:penicillin-binding protein 2 [Solemya pervernicosa gill symbiont]|uniref:Peptidoglycan D,D-transpeptidase MrdA n=2 Tax=Gammaproteobacteria incertae sedis TaxID=118884 RepID=A0A1T2L4B1_9GAMM|nr:penicillin-binding protein 2 [Candidatus Reidiella endopervernicosa]OOZ39929.1 penicillin-binding protein 2 [Solemya pervernicosa gill symbiont]QKQ25982.1 penicillin-binding protein 2 [Candidatus Reidiella endopervernicosa]
MVRRNTLKDHLRENRMFVDRVVVALVVMVLLLAVLVGQMVNLQIYDYPHYTTLSEGNRVRITAIPPTRGLIYDRNGVVLAENQPSFRLEITREQIEDIDATLAKLQQLITLSENDIKRFRSLYNNRRRFEGIPLRFRLNEEELSRLSVELHSLPGVAIVAHLNRHYPLGAQTAHIVGYVGRINERELRSIDPSDYSGTSHIGKIGIEKSYEDQLHGGVGVRQVEVNAQGRTLRTLSSSPPVPGKDIHLSIDTRLQRTAEVAFGDEQGALVAIDPRNGEVLAMVSRPDFDPNLFVNGISTADYRLLSDDAAQPLFNRAIRGQYPPGSTIKPLVGLAGLEYGIANPRQKTFCPGYYQLPDHEHKYRDWKKRGHGAVDLEDSIVQSCDVYFYDLANTLGIDRLHEFLGHFGLGSRTGIDLPGEARGLLPSRQWKRATRNQPWYPGETLIVGIGQGFNTATPLQLSTATAWLAMGGKRLKPHLVTRLDSDDGQEIMPHTKLKPIPIKKHDNWDLIVESMSNVVHGVRGTARRIGTDAQYQIAGKTGTAQVFGIKQEEEYEEEKIAKKLRDHALFVSYAPVEDPQIAIAVIVENGGSGGAVAAPIARAVMDRYLLESDN